MYTTLPRKHEMRTLFALLRNTFTLYDIQQRTMYTRRDYPHSKTFPHNVLCPA